MLTLELIRALAAAPSRFAHLTMIVGDWVPEGALCGVEQLVDQVVYLHDLKDIQESQFDLIHKPSQIFKPDELDFLQRCATRFVISHLDCISFSNPSYAESPEQWRDLRQLTHATFISADGIAFLSHAAAQEATHFGLTVPADRICVTYVGVDHQLHNVSASPPALAQKLQERPFILVLGTNFKHKNRLYALRLLRSLIARYSWPGSLVFAGPSVSWGGSETEEAQEIQAHAEIGDRVHYLGSIAEASKQWLLEHAALVMYPSTREGFGMVPFEAAAAGTPALTTRLTSLGEVLGGDMLTLDTFDPDAGADLAWSLCTDVAKRHSQVVPSRHGPGISPGMKWRSGPGASTARSWICRRVTGPPG